MSLAIRNDTENAALLEKVLTTNDLAGLTSMEKCQHLKNICEVVGLNPVTKPIQLLKFNGKEIAYFTKDATEQLRKINKISLKIRDTKIQEGIYIVLVDAIAPDGREDSATGAVSIKGLIGDALCNAILKAETKAKRRVTLSICGLGFTDESEIETMRGARKIEVSNEVKLIESDMDELDFKADEKRLEKVSTLEELEEVYKASYKFWSEKRDSARLKKIVDIKDIRKKELKEVPIFTAVDETKQELFDDMMRK